MDVEVAQGVELRVARQAVLRRVEPDGPAAPDAATDGSEPFETRESPEPLDRDEMPEPPAGDRV